MMSWYRRTFLPPQVPRVVLVTGASSGIGRATTLLLAALGDRVVATARRLDRLESLKDEAERANLPGAILPVEADVTDAAAMARAVQAALDAFGRLDAAIVNAGIGHRGALAESDWADLETVLRTNIDGALHTIRAAVPAIRAGAAEREGHGQIVFISSILGPVPGAYAAIYSASKAATDALARALRGELRADRIAVSVLWVGQTHSEFAQNRLGRPGRVATRWPTMSPEDVAGGVVRALERRPRTMTLRWIDALFVWAGQRFPGLIDRVLARIYGPRA